MWYTKAALVVCAAGLGVRFLGSQMDGTPWLRDWEMLMTYAAVLVPGGLIADVMRWLTRAK